MKYGKYCGAYWSDGAYQTSVVGTQTPIDDLDYTCYLHDAQYASGGDLSQADYEFYANNVGKGFMRTAAGLAVGAQGLVRWGTSSAPNDFDYTQIDEIDMTNAKKPNLRGAAAATRNQAPRQQQLIHTTMVPAAMGSTMRSGKPTVVRTSNSARITSRDFLSTVSVNPTAVFGLSTTALLSPAYLSSGFLGNLCRSYESYKWNRLRVHYVPAVSTATPGTVLLASAHSVTQPSLSGEESNFLPRAMTQGNAVLGPLWEHNHIDIDCARGGKRSVDPTTSTDIDDNIHEELQVYFSAATNTVAGYLFIEYDCSFFDPIYQPHATTIPIPWGPGSRCVLQESVATSAAGDDWTLSVFSGLTLSTITNGTIFRGVLDVSSSLPAVGATMNNLINTATYSHSTSTAFAVTTQALPLVGGTLLYFVVDGTQLKVYSSIESARSGIGSGQLLIRTAYTAVGTYAFIMAMVGLDNSSIATIQ